jgi:hypothetical protein
MTTISRTVMLIAAVVAAMLSGTSGCGKRPTAITGVVTLDGRPVPGAWVDVLPIAGDAPTAGGFADARGRYRLNVSPTTYALCVRAERATGERRVVDDPAQPAGTTVAVREQYLPMRYTREDLTPFKVTAVAEKTITFDIIIDQSEK